MVVKIPGGEPRPQNVSTMTLQNVKKSILTFFATLKKVLTYNLLLDNRYFSIT